MKKQNWFSKLVSRLCNRNKKETFPTVNIPYDEVKKYIHKVNVEFNVSGNNENDIKNELSNYVAEYLVENDLITYFVIFFQKCLFLSKHALYLQLNFYCCR